MDKYKLLQGKEGCELTAESSHAVIAHAAPHKNSLCGKGKFYVGFFF